MNAMSVFNSNVPEQSNPIFNLDWSANPTGRDVEKAANKVAGSVDKGTERMTSKLSTDIQKNADIVTSAIKDNTDKVTDAVKRSAVNNASTNLTPPMAAVVDGLLDMSKATSDIAKFLLANPNEMPAAVEAAKGVSRQFEVLTEAASGYDAGTSKLGNEVSEISKVLDWIDYKFSIPDGSGKYVPITNSAADVVGAFGRMSDFN